MTTHHIRASLLALAVLAAMPQLTGCTAEVAASEPALVGEKLWNGYHADIRLIVYDDMNPNINKRKVAYSDNLSTTSDAIKALVNGLAPTDTNLHCSDDGKVYVLEITETGSKRKFASHNNWCKGNTSYAGYVPTDTLGHLAQALSQAVPN